MVKVGLGQGEDQSGQRSEQAKVKVGANRKLLASPIREVILSIHHYVVRTPSRCFKAISRCFRAISRCFKAISRKN